MQKKGYLILENNSILEGYSFGSEKTIVGEVVFNTGMMGYPESFTDASYFGQILTMTYPLIGNYGSPRETKENTLLKNFEADKLHIRGLIVSSYMDNNTHWQSAKTLSQLLREQDIPALEGIDTRSLTKVIREKGVMKGIVTFKKPKGRVSEFYDINAENLVAKVSCRKPKVYGDGNFTLLLIDCGLKFNQIRLMLKRDVRIVQVPWDYDPFIEKKYEFDAILLSNGPGDARLCLQTINTVKKAMRAKIPTLGICLGHQILALAAGGDIYKMKYGHRSQNQPVIDVTNNKCFITSQNHGFSVKLKSVPKPWTGWFINLNDSTCEGMKHPQYPFMSAQFHPEAAPGPVDTEWIFDDFLEIAKKWTKNQN